MPGDGHCLYHALGWWDRKPQAEIRSLLATIGEPEWRDICPWDDVTGLAEFQRETLDPNIWGGAVQIAAMARIRGFCVCRRYGALAVPVGVDFRRVFLSCRAMQ